MNIRFEKGSEDIDIIFKGLEALNIKGQSLSGSAVILDLHYRMMAQIQENKKPKEIKEPKQMNGKKIEAGKKETNES